MPFVWAGPAPGSDAHPARLAESSRLAISNAKTMQWPVLPGPLLWMVVCMVTAISLPAELDGAVVGGKRKSSERNYC